MGSDIVQTYLMNFAGWWAALSIAAAWMLRELRRDVASELEDVKLKLAAARANAKTLRQELDRALQQLSQHRRRAKP